MAVNTCEMWSKGIKITFFFPKTYKNRPTAGGFAPTPSGGWGQSPLTPVSDTSEYTSFLNTFPKLDIFAF